MDLCLRNELEEARALLQPSSKTSGRCHLENWPSPDTKSISNLILTFCLQNLKKNILFFINHSASAILVQQYNRQRQRPSDAESLETQSRIMHCTYSASDFHFAKITVYSVENDDKKRQEMKQGDELGR